MNDIYEIARTPEGLAPEEIRRVLLRSLKGRQLRKMLNSNGGMPPMGGTGGFPGM